jgi:hypothetical protein
MLDGFISKPYCIDIYKHPYTIRFKENNMILFNESNESKEIMSLSIDPNLTPENFEQKFKTYLNFS